MSKYKSIDATLVIWCNWALSNSTFRPSEHQGYFQERHTTKASFMIFVDHAEKCGWRYINGNWFCPACKEAADDE